MYKIHVFPILLINKIMIVYMTIICGYIFSFKGISGFSAFDSPPFFNGFKNCDFSYT